MNPPAPQVANFGGTIFAELKKAGQTSMISVRFRNRVTCWPKEIQTAKTMEILYVN